MADDTSPLELMDRATAGIEEAGSFTEWVRNANLGTILLSITVAISSAILALGETILAPFQAIAAGLAEFIRGTFGAGVGVIDAGGTATELSFLEGASAALGPAAFPVAVASVVVSIYIVSRGFQRFSPLDWIGGLFNFRR